ncbi:putative quinol monooxygenase [Marinomonas algicola]|jgi:(4S)-4-hydroxy-5-phosphonooxypentane-2,3-dione isomerase|uniref:putative quinol monooxygenase n=1 Tax=Marinomonas algicola TaxID=2773454 RepID=UPI00174A329B|nr:antibiotic biosynthesis monooxygenase [Marinomonas algicola]
MYVITVVFSVYQENMEEFSTLVKKQAEDSLKQESECHTFDVVIGEGDGITVPFFLYEIYSTKSSFDVHLATDHFNNFSDKTACMVAKKEVQAWNKLN